MTTQILGQWYDNDTGALAAKTIKHHYSCHFLFVYENNFEPLGIHLVADIGRWRLY